MDVSDAAHRLRLLLIDDRRDAAVILKALLVRSGHDVMTAEDGATGVELARQFCPDVIISDITLAPPLDGFEVAALVRADANLADCHLIAITGHDDDEYRARARTAGYAHYLVKPVKFQDLLAILTTLPEKRAC